MKKCDYFKDLILTDFIDGQLDKNTAGDVERHLLECHDCRVFLKEVKDGAALPLRGVLSKSAPDELWETIKQRIEEENQARVSFWDVGDRLKGLIAFPRMVPVFASLTVIFLVGSVTINTVHLRQAQARDQGEYLVSLLGSTSASDSNDLGTPIEHYFL